MIKLKNILPEYFGRSPKDREKAIDKWLQDKRDNAPGQSHHEKVQWLWDNDPQYVKLVKFITTADSNGKYLSFAPRQNVDAYKASFQSDKYFVRFGDLPPGGKSMNHLIQKNEKGISSYPVKWDKKRNKWNLDSGQLSDIGMATLDSLISEFISKKGRPIYLIHGQDLMDLGIHDDEPLLDVNNIKIVKKLEPSELYIDEFGGDDWYGND